MFKIFQNTISGLLSGDRTVGW